MKTSKNKKKKKFPNTALSREDFAFLCELIMKGSDQMLDDLWEEQGEMLAEWQKDFSLEDQVDPFSDKMIDDWMIDEEQALFSRVEGILNKVCRRFGYHKPIYSEDVQDHSSVALS